MIDLYMSRRDKFIKCTYWSQERNPDYVNGDQIVYKELPTGVFYAKEINPYTVESQVIAETFMVEQKSVVVQTDDDISDLRRNDLVKIDELEYRVENIQIAPKKNQRQFLKKQSNSYYVSLRG